MDTHEDATFTNQTENSNDEILLMELSLGKQTAKILGEHMLTMHVAKLEIPIEICGVTYVIKAEIVGSGNNDGVFESMGIGKYPEMPNVR